MNDRDSSIDDKLHHAIDVDQLILFQAEVLRQMILDPKGSAKLSPLDTIDAIVENVRKHAEFLKQARKELGSPEP